MFLQQGYIPPRFIIAPFPHIVRGLIKFWADSKQILNISIPISGQIQERVKPFASVEGKKKSRAKITLNTVHSKHQKLMAIPAPLHFF